MHSQLDKVFLLGMSSPHITEMDYAVRPPKLFLFLKSLKNDQEEEEEEEERAMDQQSKVLREGEDDNFTLPTPPSSPSSYQDDHDHDHETKMTREMFCKKNIVSTDVDDDEGYHTPTSPRHRIPAALQCPLAPRKRWQQQQQQRRRKRGRAVCLCLVPEIDGGDDMLMAKTKKKARE